MADVTLTYKGSTIAEMDASGSKTLKTSGKYCEGDIGVSYVKPSGGGSGPEIPDSAFVISGDCAYLNYKGKWDTFIDVYKNKWSTSDITDAICIFNGSSLSSIPFEINCATDYQNANNMFGNCGQLTIAPKINNLMFKNISKLFSNCYKLKTIPNDFCDSWLYNPTNSLNQSNIFDCCYSLRSVPMNIFECGNLNIRYSNSYFYFGFYHCFNLDELINLPIPYGATWTSNCLEYTFSYCERLKNIVFAKQADGTPYTVNWKSQVINLTNNVGYVGDNIDNILSWNSGITADKEIKDATTYAALKNDIDWFTCDVAYSRYNHDSAVATINSLPDTSAYLATAGGTNTIKFNGAAGSATDGGAINTLTEEEIAVATAKGWTVSLI